MRQGFPSPIRRRTPIILVHLFLLAVAGLLITVVGASGPFGLDCSELLPGILVVAIIWCYWSWRKVGGTLNHPYVWFLASTVLYNASLTILRLFGLDSASSLDSHFDAGTLARTGEYVAISLLLLHLGALLGASPRRLAVNATATRGDKSVRTAGWMLFAVAIGPAILRIQTNIGLVMHGGYFALYQQEWITGAGRTADELAAFLTPAVIFLLVGNPDSKFIRLLAIAAVSGQAIAGLFTGSRSAGVFPVVALGWAWHRAVQPISSRAVLVVILGFFIVLSPLLEATRDTAGSSRSSVQFWLDAYTGLEDPVVKGISTQGETVRTVAYTIELVPWSRPFECGMTYLTAVFAVLPNLGWRQHPAAVRGARSAWLVRTVAPSTAAVGGGLGYSYIAETYANFGWAGTLVAGFLGFAFVRWVCTFGLSAQGERVAAFASILPFILIFPRSETYDLFRPMVWYGLCPYLLVVSLNTLRSRQPGTIEVPSAVPFR